MLLETELPNKLADRHRFRRREDRGIWCRHFDGLALSGGAVCAGRSLESLEHFQDEAFVAFGLELLVTARDSNPVAFYGHR